MIKNFIRRYPGYALIVICSQLFLLAAFLAVICFNAQTIHALRSSGEVRYTAVFLSDMRDMNKLADDTTLSDEQKKLMLYQKAHSAAEALTETGYPEKIKRTVTEALNGIARHMLENGETDELLLNERELAFLRLFSGTGTEDAYETYTAMTAPTDKPEAEEAGTVSPQNFYADRRESMDMANRLFGVRNTLTPCKSPTGREYLFSCKNAYAIMNAAETYPLEAAVYVPFTQAVYTAAECRAFAESFITGVYPKKIYRFLSVSSEADLDDRVEVVFTGKGDRTVTVGISKATGRMVSLETTGLTQQGF